MLEGPLWYAGAPPESLFGSSTGEPLTHACSVLLGTSRCRFMSMLIALDCRILAARCYLDP